MEEYAEDHRARQYKSKSVIAYRFIILIRKTEYENNNNYIFHIYK